MLGLSASASGRRSSVMNSIVKPWHILVTSMAGWVNHRQQDAIDFLRTENQILKEKLGTSLVAFAIGLPDGV